MIRLEEVSVNSGQLSNLCICVLISFVKTFGGWNFDHKIHIFLFLHSPSIHLMIHGKFHSEYFCLSCLKLFCGFFCNLLHFPGFPSAPPRAVFACPVEAWPSLHLHLQCQDRVKCLFLSLCYIVAADFSLTAVETWSHLNKF